MVLWLSLYGLETASVVMYRNNETTLTFIIIMYDICLQTFTTIFQLYNCYTKLERAQYR